MRVALINSPTLNFKGVEFSIIPPSWAIAAVHGYLNKKGIKMKLFDLNTILWENKELFLSFSKIDSELHVEEFILRYNDLVKTVVDYFLSKINLEECKVLGISIIESQSLKIMLPFMKKVKKIYPDIKIVVGGTVNSLIKDKYFFGKTVDFISYEEESFSLVIKAIENKTDFSNISSHIEFDISDQTLKFNKKNIDKYRFLQGYYNIFNDLFNTPTLPYCISKGCLYECSFCTGHTKSIMYKKPEQIVKDLREIKRDYGYKYFIFLHQHLTISKSFIQELCDNIVDSKLDILWTDCIKPLEYLSQNLYYKLRETGCIGLSYGIETGSPRIMKLMNKDHSVSDCENNLKYADKAGIWTVVNFIVGFPTEGEKEFNETLDFIKRNSDYINIAIASKFRLEDDTLIINNPEKFGIRTSKDRIFSGYSATSTSKYDEIGGISYEELQKVHDYRFHKIPEFFRSLNSYVVDYPPSRTLIFPLYDYLGSKEKVKLFFKQNYDIIRRLNNGFCSLFTGAYSNQKLKGNLHSCDIDDFNLVKIDKLVKRMEEIYNDGFKKLVIVGGEPLIRKDIFEILSKAKDIGFDYIVIKTNARMLEHKNFCGKLSKYVNEILVINPSEDEKEYESVAGVKGSYSEAMEGIKNWKKLNKKMRYYL